MLKLFTAFDDDEYVCMVLELCAKGELLKYAATNKDSRQTKTFTENESMNNLSPASLVSKYDVCIYFPFANCCSENYSQTNIGWIIVSAFE